MIWVILTMSIFSLMVSMLTAVVCYIKFKSVWINFYNISKGLDTLYSNDSKIIELTKIKGFVQLVNEEEQTVRKEIVEERTKLGRKKDTGSLRPSDSDPDDKTN
jgi:hypothetical protein